MWGRIANSRSSKKSWKIIWWRIEEGLIIVKIIIIIKTTIIITIIHIKFLLVET